jgi:hypothetical protein
MKPGPHFEKTANTSSDLDRSCGWPRDARKDLQKSALACAIATDDAENVPSSDLEGYLLESPELFRGGL